MNAGESAESGRVGERARAPVLKHRGPLKLGPNATRRGALMGIMLPARTCRGGGVL